ncbi:MAG: hypothetical protein RL557_892 [archaeon]
MGGGECLRGMPLGNYTSQWFANIYLGKLDKFVKHYLRAKYYIRYVDDFVIFSYSKIELEQWKNEISQFLEKELLLSLHPDKSRIIPLNKGIHFLGLRIFYYHSLIRESNKRNFERRFKELKILYREDRIPREKVVESLEGWLTFAKHANSYKYCRELLRNFNKSFPIRHKNEIIRTKKIKNFFRKVYASKVDFSLQKTLFLFHKKLTYEQIADKRSIKQGTVWKHFSDLIEYGQLSVWSVVAKRKIIRVLSKIKNVQEPLKQIKERIHDKTISYDEINCVKSHLKMKDKIKNIVKS